MTCTERFEAGRSRGQSLLRGSKTGQTLPEPDHFYGAKRCRNGFFSTEMEHHITWFHWFPKIGLAPSHPFTDIGFSPTPSQRGVFGVSPCLLSPHRGIHRSNSFGEPWRSPEIKQFVNIINHLSIDWISDIAVHSFTFCLFRLRI